MEVGEVRNMDKLPADFCVIDECIGYDADMVEIYDFQSANETITVISWKVGHWRRR